MFKPHMTTIMDPHIENENIKKYHKWSKKQFTYLMGDLLKMFILQCMFCRCGVVLSTTFNNIINGHT